MALNMATTGTALLICAALCALAGAAFAARDLRRDGTQGADLALRCLTGQGVVTLAALVLLASAFAQSDFSLRYVAAHSHTDLPLAYRIAAVWGGHEGSLLLWVFLLVAFGLVAATRVEGALRSGALAVLGTLGVAFLAFVVATSNPFAALDPPVTQGADLNPLLQDPLLVIHPPLLYLGYAGLAAVFTLAVGAMLADRVGRTFARAARQIVLMAWVFLTLGITLGSFWAYYELGWGGWWFWDPVENASLMPWLAATALLHTLGIAVRKGTFLRGVLLLSILCFGLSLLGTFLVRSGVLTSVHAFATDPARGVFVLALFAAFTGVALFLYMRRAEALPRVESLDWRSREALILAGGALLLVMMATVLLGTLYPLLYEALGLGKISVGAPYFNQVIVPMAVPLLVLMGIATLRPVLNAVRARRLTAHMLAMALGHGGIAVLVAGIALSEGMSVEVERSFAPGEEIAIGGHVFRFEGTRRVDGPNYRAMEAQVVVHRDGEAVTLHSQKRRYPAAGRVMTEAGIDVSLARHLYVTLGERTADGRWTLRYQVRPFISLLWLGALVAALGGVVAIVAGRVARVRQPDTQPDAFVAREVAG